MVTALGCGDNDGFFAMEDEVDEIEGEPGKRFAVWRADIDNVPYVCEGEYDTIVEVLRHRWRMDRRYRIRVEGKFLTLREFETWAESNKNYG